MYLRDLGAFFGSFLIKKSLDFGVPEALEDASGAMLASMGAQEPGGQEALVATFSWAETTMRRRRSESKVSGQL